MERRPAGVLAAVFCFVGIFSAQTSLLMAQSSGSAPPVRPTTITAVEFGVSKPLRDMPPEAPSGGTIGAPREMPDKPPFLHPRPNTPKPRDPIVQRSAGGKLIPSPMVNFDGVSDVNGVQPPDTTLDVSGNQILQWVNLSYQVYDKAGTPLGGPFAGIAFWNGLSGACSTNNGGDILVRWDQFASRWFVSQLAYPGGAVGYHQCVAVSTTSDALGSYYQYDYLYGLVDSNDYPKVGLWPDVDNNGYYITVRNFVNNTTFGGMKIIAVDRVATLAGNPGVAQVFDVGALAPNLDGLLPADLRGPNVPSDGSRETFIGYGHALTDGSATPVIHLFQTHTDFADPTNSTLVQLADIPVADFNPGFSSGDPVPQQGGGLIELLPFSMYRADYRVFRNADGSFHHDSLLLLHDVNVADSGEQAGERWHEVRGIAAGGPPALFQEGTYGPSDNTWRWMGSIAQDASGNLALGFSASSDGSGIVADPSVHYTGRLAGDPLGLMTQGEGTLFDSTQSFEGDRWGDYSQIVADPTDQCTFWFTTEYGAGDWNTRIGSFRFPSCTTGPSGTLEGHVTNGSSPLAGASVTAGANTTVTDVAGHYSFTLPVGSYAMTVTKYGFVAGGASGVGVTDGGDTIQDFVLTPAPTTLVNGVVKDGSGGNWPLYAVITITGPGAPLLKAYTDPVTGYYAITLVSGIQYSFQVDALVPGYNSLSAPVPLHRFVQGGTVFNFTLTVNATTCKAAGYSASTAGLFESFDNGTLPPGWTLVNNNVAGGGLDWTINTGADPCGFFTGNLTGGAGPYALSNSNCDGFVTDDQELRTPSVNLSGLASAVLRFNTDYRDLFSTADVDISTNGGTIWTNVWEKSGIDARGPRLEVVDISSIAAGHADVRARFHFTGDFAWWWQVDNVLVGQAGCNVKSGGLVVGNVRDVNTGGPLNGATVTNTGGDSTISFAVPGDPNQPGGFYALFAPSGPQPFTASLTLYGNDAENATVIPNGAVRRDFSLTAGRLSASPSPLTLRLDPGQTGNLTLNLNNTGGLDTSFLIRELNVGPTSRPRVHGPFADPEAMERALSRISKGLEHRKSAKGLAGLLGAPATPRLLAGGNVLHTYPSGLAAPWGVMFNTDASDFWVSNIQAAGGDNKVYRFLTDGTSTGDTIDATPWVASFPADGAYNARTGMLWEVNVGGDDCIYEMNPVSKVSTGNKICPAFGTSERGLAYDVTTDTYYSASWNDGVINHFDGGGMILDSAFVGVPISGLAFNPSTRHLFAMSNHDTPTGGADIYVYETANNYNLIGGFFVESGGAPVLTAFGGSGMEIDCNGHLWLVDQNNSKILEVDSGETGVCNSNDIPWLSENPSSGSVPAHTILPDAVTFDATGLTPGLRQGQLFLRTDTPYTLPAVQVNLTVRFSDVPDGSFASEFIYGLAGAGITGGCSPTAFCPADNVTRAQIAVFIELGIHGRSFTPPPATGIFTDVTPSSFAAAFIEQLFHDGIAAGCGGGAFCPGADVTRAQMAVFLVKAVHGQGFVPPAATGIFSDVPPSAFAAAFIEQLFHDGITGGCSPTTFCPNQNVTRAQMAVFLVTAFHLPHL